MLQFYLVEYSYALGAYCISVRNFIVTQLLAKKPKE